MSPYNALKQFLMAFLLTSSVVAFQQSYARSHQSGIEQPVGLLGFAEYFFRHPETFLGLHFSYKVTPVSSFAVGTLCVVRNMEVTA
jgi:hypothetical protein